MLRIWAALDGLFLAYYLVTTVMAEKIPFASYLLGAWTASVRYGSALPLAVGELTSVLVLSMFWSSYALWRGRRFGRPLVYAQLPFRLFLVVPSVFFLPWLFLPFQHSLDAPIVLIVLILVTEALKLLTVGRAYGRRSDLLKPPPSGGAGGDAPGRAAELRD